MLQEIRENSVITAFGVALSALGDYLAHNPATAISTVIMLLVAWEKYRIIRLERQRKQKEVDKKE